MTARSYNRDSPTAGPSSASAMNIAQVVCFNAVCPWAMVQRTGPHDVGTMRTSVRVGGAGGRSLKIQLWYPAESELAVTSRLLTSWARLLHPVWAPAHRGVQLSSTRSKFPFITYVPDAPDCRQDNTYTLANLASHGFILAAIRNPFSLPDETLPRADTSGTAPGTSDRRVRSGVLAASTLLDALSELKPSSPIAAWVERLDLKRVGILGYALGGTVAVASVAVDSRYSVAANLDGEEGEGPLVKVPYLIMRSDPAARAAREAAGEDKARRPPATASLGSQQQRTRTQASLPTSHIIEVKGTRREHFSDRLISSSLFATAQQRSANMRVRAIIDAYTVAFFKTYLEVSPHPLMCVRHSPYPEVRFIDDNESDIHFPLMNPRLPRLGGEKSEPH